jgi:CRISPR-associated protein Csm3
MNESKGSIQLKGRLFLTFDILAVTGLHIGGATEDISIGGVDKTVIRDPLTNRPYIPGSSLRGKMRSLIEKYKGKEQNQRINQGFIHSCQNNEWEKYRTCEVCQVFGVPGEREFGTPARLIVRDVHMDKDSADQLEKLQTDLPFSEVKVEVAIDRVTSQANPRQIERVPAGTLFGGAEMVYSLYAGQFKFGKEGEERAALIDPQSDLKFFDTTLEGLQLLEDDYLGGAGARGSGKVRFVNLRLGFKGNGGVYAENSTTVGQESYDSVAALRGEWNKILKGNVLQQLGG